MNNFVNNPPKFQKHLKEAIDKYSVTLIIQARQIGVTHTIINHFFQRMISFAEYSGLIVFDTHNTLKRNFQKTAEILSRYCFGIHCDYSSKTFYFNRSSLKFCSRGDLFSLRGLYKMDSIYIEDIHFYSGISDCFTSALALLKIPSGKIILSMTSAFLYWKWINPSEDKLFVARLLTQNNFEKIFHFDSLLNTTVVDQQKLLDCSGIRPFISKGYDTSWMLFPKENSHCIFMCRYDKHRHLSDFCTK